MARLRGSFRYQIQTQSVDGQLLRDLVRDSTVGLKLPDGVGWIVDVDPVDMM
jgi:primosomal protein N'